MNDYTDWADMPTAASLIKELAEKYPNLTDEQYAQMAWSILAPKEAGGEL